MKTNKELNLNIEKFLNIFDDIYDEESTWSEAEQQLQFLDDLRDRNIIQEEYIEAIFELIDQGNL